MIVDSHCHLNLLPKDNLGSIDEIVARARELDVSKILTIGLQPADWDQTIELAEHYEAVYAAIGIHPCEAEQVSVDDETFLHKASHPKVLAVGEVGLDYHHFDADTQSMDWQQNRFRQMIRLAISLGKPLIIHTRNSTPDCLRILKEEGAEQVGGIMHCFVEDLATANAAMELGFYISFSGIVTFKNAVELKDVAKAIPMDRILVETDSPYLAPVPYRGKPNQPGYTRYVAEEIARLKECSLTEVARATTENFHRLFGLDD